MIKISTIENKAKSLFRTKDIPDISVVIPFYNVKEYLEECLDSLFEQQGVTLEAILVDDGSTDGSTEIVKRYMTEHNNIKLLRANNKGPGHARNRGVKHAKGKYIAFLDADDVLVKGIYRRMIRAANNNNADVCICNAARFKQDKKWSSNLHDKVYKDYEICTNITKTPSLIYDTCCWNKLINREFYKRNAITFPEGVVYEDISFNANLYIKSSKVVMLAETGYFWRVRDDQANQSLSQKYFTEKNIKDRFQAADWLIQNIVKKDFPFELKAMTQRRLLDTDLKVILDSVNYIEGEQAEKIFHQVKAFIEKNISKDVMNTLSVIDLQRYNAVMNGDVESYKKLLDYRIHSYSKAPVEEREYSLIATLPGDLFTVEKRSMNDEFERMQRLTWVDSIRVVDGEIEICAHLYIRRYDMPDIDSQKLKVCLINEEQNRRIIVDHEARKTDYLTKKFGTERDDISGIISHYNYDWTGFSFRIGKNIWGYENRYIRTKYSVVVDYEDRLFRGTQIIRNCDERKIEEYEKKMIKKDNKIAYIRIGEQKELHICVKRIDK